MSKTYAQLTAEIDKLKAQAEALRADEVRGVVDKIKAAIAQYGLTAKDLGLAGARPVANAKASTKGKKPKASKKRVAAKYADGNGNTWVGRGKRPRWITEALASGQTLESFLAR